MSNHKSTGAKLHSYRSDKGKQLKRSPWAGRGAGIMPKGINSNNQFR